LQSRNIVELLWSPVLARLATLWADAFKRVMGEIVDAEVPTEADGAKLHVTVVSSEAGDKRVT
jgi:hypothetical protein